MPTSRQRRDAARRHLERQLQRRGQQDATRKRFALIASIVGTLVVIVIVLVFLIAVTNDERKSKQAGTNGGAASPTGSAARSSAPGVCDFAKSGAAARKAAPPASPVPTTGTVDVRVATNRGTLTVTLNRASAPCTVASFIALAQQKYFDKTPCHRLVTDGIYVLQCGDPTGTGTGGPGYTVPDEATGTETYPAGTVAMARTQAPNSGGSQFFIVYKDSPNLEQHLGAQQYTVFGKLASGLSTVAKIAAGGVQGGGTDGTPKLSTEIDTMQVIK